MYKRQTQIFIDFIQAYDNTVLLEIMLYFQIPIKLTQLTRLTMIQTTAKVTLQTGTTDIFNVTRKLKQGDGLAGTNPVQPSTRICDRKLSIGRNGRLEHKMVHIIGYTDDFNITVRFQGRARDLPGDLLKCEAEEIVLQAVSYTHLFCSSLGSCHILISSAYPVIWTILCSMLHF